MVAKGLGNLLEETISVTPWSRKLYSNAEEFWKESEGLHYAYLIFRTLRGDYKQFKPDAVFYVGKSPAAYLKKVAADEIPEDDIRDWQRFLWNQTVVPMLIIQSRLRVHVYTAYVPPKERDSQDRIIPILENMTDTLELDQLLTAIEAGTIYEKKPEAFYKLHAVDRYLLDNLNAAALQLAETQGGGVDNQENLKFAHTFMTRLLFVCYLVERGMIKGEHFDDDALKKLRPETEDQEGYFLRHLFDDLGTYSKKRNALCRLFVCVKELFNGSLFPDNGVKGEKDNYNESFIKVLDLFLHGHNLKDSQLMLGFWAYDFSVIPIETISAVYESFLEAQGKIRKSFGKDDTKRTAGAYYTPLHLAELTVDIALENIDKPVHELKILDPACGSGVFLVCMFSRMVESLRRKENHIEKRRSIGWARKLLPLLGQLYGIDISSTACHITCFSLYLALLEQVEPKHVEYLYDHGEKLPPLLANTVKNSLNTIFHGNVFNPQISLAENDFQIIIGNPPWVSRENQKDSYFLEWQSKNHEVYGPGFQIAHGFMWKVPELLSEFGIGCLLVPSAVFLNNSTNKFQKEWLSSYTVDKVINFSDLSFFLFEDTDRPCMAIRFTKHKPTRDHTISYESPKTDKHSQFAGPIYVREEDITTLRIKNIIDASINKKAPVEWKTHFWGTWRDQRLLNRLLELPKLYYYVGTPRKPKRFIKCQGFQPFNPKPTSDIEKIKRKKEPEKPWWPPDKDYLPIGKMQDLVVTLKDCVKIGNKFPLLLFPRDPKIYSGPKVLVSQGSKDMKVAFCNDDIIFRSTLQTITGTAKEDKKLLRFLSAVIKSDIAQYYLFHTSSNWGTERDKVLFYELLSLPFFTPEESSDKTETEIIINEVAAIIENFEKKVIKGEWLNREDEAKHIRRKELELLIRKYYDIDNYEAMLIEDTLMFSKESSTPSETCKNIPTLEKVQVDNCRNYAETLCEMLNNFGSGSSFNVNGEVIQGNPYSIIRVSLTDKINKNIPVIKAKEKLTYIFKRMESLLQQKQGRFVFCQNLKVFDGNDLYILKPMQMRFWTRTAALNDADEVAGALLKS